MSTAHREDSHRVHISGDYSRVNVVAGDVVYTDGHGRGKPDFFKPTLTEYTSPPYIGPVMSDELLEVVGSQRVIVLGGPDVIDKVGLLRHLAWLLRERLNQASENDTDIEIPILEWHRSSDTQGLVIAIQEAAEKSIFILPEIEPLDLAYEFDPVQKAAFNRHYVFISTQAPYEKWKTSETAKTFWRELPEDGLYTSEALLDYLLERLTEAKEQLPSDIAAKVETGVDSQPVFIGELTCVQIAEMLKTPDNIARFVQLLCSEPVGMDEMRAEKLVALACDPQRLVRRWFHQILDPRQQLLALGLSFFDGLFEDQFFAALEHVVEDAWKRRDGSLRALDYCDLEGLQNFFRFTKDENGFVRIESRNSDQRKTILQVAWRSHRRQILSALPTLSKLARSSVPYRSFDTELYGTNIQRNQVREVVARTISDVGLLSDQAVADTLFSLAADESISAQAVAARAIARWREFDADEQMYTLLKRWQTDKGVFDQILALLTGQDVQRADGPRAYIRATVALTVGYAGRYDLPNNLSAHLEDLFTDLAEDISPLVRRRFCEITLPMLVSLHLEQLRTHLRSMTRYEELEQPIAVSLALAYRSDPSTVLQLLEDWTRESFESRPERLDTSLTTLREGILATVALTYGEIGYQHEGAFGVVDRFDRIDNILSHERHPFVRTACMVALVNLARENFGVVEAKLQELVMRVDENERTVIVKALTETYLEQRSQSDAGEDEIEVNGRRYPVWIDSVRPLTAIETAMFRWIKNPANQKAQELATQASIAFAKELEQKEAELLEEIRQARDQRDSVEIADTSALGDEDDRPLGFFSRVVVPWWVTLDAPQHREVIRGLLPEVIAQDKVSTDSLRFVLSKWQRVEDDDLQSIAGRLDRALRLVRFVRNPLHPARSAARDDH